MSPRPRGQRIAEHIIRRGCRHLPGDIRDERYREWAAELPAILDDPGIRLPVLRSARALSYAAGTRRTTRRLNRAAGRTRQDARQAYLAPGAPGAWASRSRRRALTVPALPDGVLLAVAGVVSWLSLIVLIHAYPPGGSWNYLYVAAGFAVDVLEVIAIARLIRWARRRSRRTPRP